MNTQWLAIEVQQGKRRVSRKIEIPAEDVLIAASLDLRNLGEGKVPAVGRYGACIGVYFPPQHLSLSDVDPFSGVRSETVSGGTTSARCTFYHGSERIVAGTYYKDDPPQIYYCGTRVTAADPSLFEVAACPAEEGALREVVQNEYERNPTLRALCIRARGDRCMICGLSFGEVYGNAAVGIIHVHHLEPLGLVGDSHVVDPTRDLVPVCPNCHAVIHRRTPPFTPDEVKAMLRSRASPL
ncbi:MAG: HNH endonuclease [Phycisphaeraceae bacterium]|nr:HNH endonuclease [Phycisphaeraceae bacterium]MBX3366951.1 HNH endonuclease [Phycisphaeraceae bacterium]